MLRILIVLFLFCSHVICKILYLPEGSNCMRNGVPGKCVNIHNCLSHYLDSEILDYAPICSFRVKEPIVCCTDCTFNDTRNFFINPNVGIIHKTGQKVQDKCVEYLHKLDYPCKDYHRANMVRLYNPDQNCYDVKVEINRRFITTAVGGVDAYRGEFPHMGLLGYGYDISSADWHCGSTVISEKFILTAGHCLSAPRLGPVKYVALGLLKRSDPPELWQIYNVKRRIPHPKYMPPSKYHDIALLETDTEIKFSRLVLPACLHAAEEADEKLYATGWGALGNRRELANILQKVQITRFEDGECSKFYPPGTRHLNYGYNHTTQMCYGDKDIKDTCQGDSGGPLQTFFDNHVDLLIKNCVYHVIGVTSYGRQCGIAPSLGIYTRVIHYISWIESIVWPENV